MNSKEIGEIKKLFTKDKCIIDKICTCYVGEDKEKTAVTKDAFLALPEEEFFKYLDIFRKSLSGQIGQKLQTLKFPTDEEMPGGKQAFLLKLRNSGLNEERVVDDFYNEVINNYPSPEKYLIVLIHGTYDVPGKGKDNLEMFDASENVYEMIMCAICPVRLSKPGLGYNEAEGRIGERVRDWVVEEPDKAFLFPGYVDRGADIHEMLYYSHKPEELMPEFVEGVFGAYQPVSAKVQKEMFNDILTETVGEDVDMEVVQRVHENIGEMIEANKDDPNPLTISKPEMKQLFEASGVVSEKLEHFDEIFDEVAGEKQEILVGNIEGVRKFAIKTADIDIRVKPEAAGLIENKRVDGRPCIVIPITDNVEVNGIPVRVAGFVADADLGEEDE